MAYDATRQSVVLFGGFPALDDTWIYRGLPVPRLSVSDVSVDEGKLGQPSTANFTVTVSPASTEAVTVEYATADANAPGGEGYATAGEDYVPAAGTLALSPGQTSKMVTVAITGDDSGEPNENFLIKLSNPKNAVLGRSEGQGRIMNDDGAAPSIFINDVSVQEGKLGQPTTANFTVSMTNPTKATVALNYVTADGSEDARATAGEDYAPAAGTLVFAPGQITKTVTVLVVGDTAKEPNEKFLVDLFMPENASLQDLQGEGTIQNDDL